MEGVLRLQKGELRCINRRFYPLVLKPNCGIVRPGWIKATSTRSMRRNFHKKIMKSIVKKTERV